MASNETATTKGGLRPARRTIVKGAAWAVPAVAIAAPAAHAATSPPIVVDPEVDPGKACRHTSGPLTTNGIHMEFCFTNNSIESITVNITCLTSLQGGASQTYILPSQIVVPGGQEVCQIIHGIGMDGNGNGNATIDFNYDFGGSTVYDSVTTVGLNNLDVCPTDDRPGPPANPVTCPGTDGSSLRSADQVEESTVGENEADEQLTTEVTKEPTEKSEPSEESSVDETVDDTPTEETADVTEVTSAPDTVSTDEATDNN